MRSGHRARGTSIPSAVAAVGAAELDGSVELLRASGWRVLRGRGRRPRCPTCGPTPAATGSAWAAHRSRRRGGWPDDDRRLGPDAGRGRVRHDHRRDLPRPDLPDRRAGSSRRCSPSRGRGRRLRGGPPDVGVPRRPCRSAAWSRCCCTCCCATRHDEALLRLRAVDRLDRPARRARLGRAGRTSTATPRPIGVSPGIELITVAGVGLVALAVDTLAVTFRRAALAGLPLLVLYTVPTAVAPDGRELGRVRRGRRSRSSPCCSPSRASGSAAGAARCATRVDRENWRPEVETAPLGQVGRRVGATALGLALVVPARAARPVGQLVRLRQRRLRHGRRGREQGRRSSTRSCDLGEDLRPGENTPVIRYDGPPTYLRLVGAGRVHRGRVAAQRARGVPRRQRRRGRPGPAPPGLGAAVADQRAAATGSRSSTWRRPGCRCPTRRPGSTTSTAPGSTTPRRSTCSARTARPQQLDLPGAGAVGAPDAGTAAQRAGRPAGRSAATCELPRDFSAEVKQVARAGDRAAQTTATTGRSRCRTGCATRPSSPTRQTLDSSVTDGNGEQAILRLPARRGAATACSSPRRWR